MLIHFREVKPTFREVKPTFDEVFKNILKICPIFV